METKKRSVRKLDMLSAVEQVVELSAGTLLDAEFFKKAARPLKYISEKQGLTKKQSVMLALFIDRSTDTRIKISDISDGLRCRTAHVLRFMTDVDELVNKGLIYACREHNSIGYRVPLDVVEAFKKDEKYTVRTHSNLSCAELFETIGEIVGMREDNEISTITANIMLQSLLDCNRHLIFVQKIKSFNFREDDETLLLLFSHLFVNNNDDNVGYHDLGPFFDSRRKWNSIRNSLAHNTNPLLLAKMIEYNNDNGFVNNESYRMTWKAKDVLFPELNLASMEKENDRKNVIKHEEIVAKQLYYDEDVEMRVNDLCQLLEESRYREICSRLEAMGHRTGFTCLFYGAPGTGKTETVLQLARKTERDIMQVNISEIKSMWVGESEKNIKQVFDKYRRKVEKSSIAPILLFNEADAIIGKRQEGAERAVDKMENSIQNIILQEMENLNGILIATTNLAQNMDKAFERRFLYKIKFNKPSYKARRQIWQAMLPNLNESIIGALVEKYDFSGGQIENVARHYAIDTVLYGERADSLEKLLAHCDGERLEQNEGRRMGFVSI